MEFFYIRTYHSNYKVQVKEMEKLSLHYLIFFNAITHYLFYVQVTINILIYAIHTKILSKQTRNTKYR